MTDLLDILPGGKLVPIGKGEVEVVGISLADIGALLRRFPDLISQFQPGVSPVALIESVPAAIPVLLASGLGELGNDKIEKKLARMSASDQLTLLDAVIEQTIGGDLVPFVEKIVRIAAALGFDLAPILTATQSVAVTPSSVMSFRPRSLKSA